MLFNTLICAPTTKVECHWKIHKLARLKVIIVLRWSFALNDRTLPCLFPPIITGFNRGPAKSYCSKSDYATITMGIRMSAIVKKHRFNNSSGWFLGKFMMMANISVRLYVRIWRIRILSESEKIKWTINTNLDFKTLPKWSDKLS